MNDPVRFYLDEHIPSAVAEGLRHRGVGILTVNEAEMLGARDREHLEFANEEDCVIVSHDDDFLRLVAEGHSHSGLVYVPRERTIGEMIRGLRRLADVFAEEGGSGRVEFLQLDPMSRNGPDAWTKVQNMPWTASLGLRSRLAWPLVRAQFTWQGIDWGKRWKVFGARLSSVTAAAASPWTTG